MAATTRPVRHEVRVHGAEVSTDRDTILGYAETLALLLALVAVAGAAWMVATPPAGADLLRPAADASAPIVQVERASTVLPGVTDVLQPDPAGPRETSIVVEVPAPVLGTASARAQVDSSLAEALAG